MPRARRGRPILLLQGSGPGSPLLEGHKEDVHAGAARRRLDSGHSNSQENLPRLHLTVRLCTRCCGTSPKRGTRIMSHGVSSLAIVSKNRNKLTSGMMKNCVRGSRRRMRVVGGSFEQMGQGRPLGDAAGRLGGGARRNHLGKSAPGRRSSKGRIFRQEDFPRNFLEFSRN